MVTEPVAIIITDFPNQLHICGTVDLPLCYPVCSEPDELKTRMLTDHFLSVSSPMRTNYLHKLGKSTVVLTNNPPLWKDYWSINPL